MPTVEYRSHGWWPAGRRARALACLVTGLAVATAAPALAQQSEDASKTPPTFQIQPLKLPRLPLTPHSPGSSQSQSSAEASSAVASVELAHGAKGFLWLDRVPGPVSQQSYRGWIELLGVREPIVASVAPAASGAGRARMQPVTIAKPLDSASVPLRRMLVSGRPISRSELVLVGGPRSLELYRLILENVIVARLDTTMHDGNVVEEVELAYDRVTWQFNLYHADGAKRGSITGCWDYRANREC